MALRVANICIDCADPIAQATWWSEVLEDFHRVPDGIWTGDEAELRGPGGRWLEFLKVPEGKVVKNRLHLCLRPARSERDAEVERLLGLGATVVDDLRHLEEAGGWVVLADPEGNEFCVLTEDADATGIAPA